MQSTQPYALLHNDLTHTIMDEHKQAFNGIKKALRSSVFFHFPIYDGKAQFIIQIDTSMTTIGRILCQESSNDKWVIAYNRCLLIDVQTWYRTYN
uniref:Reverse transcriptase/retrotransposon-derived protein RNase H-like domain-containing protein n=1 Tax=Romanomermis culicivorax TaxID=13658 RepID=A0A915J4Q4_ROMCU